MPSISRLQHDWPILTPGSGLLFCPKGPDSTPAIERAEWHFGSDDASHPIHLSLGIMVLLRALPGHGLFVNPAPEVGGRATHWATSLDQVPWPMSDQTMGDCRAIRRCK